MITAAKARELRQGNATYAGSYRIAYLADGSRFLEVRRPSGFQRLAKPIPAHVVGAYNAANHFGV